MIYENRNLARRIIEEILDNLSNGAALLFYNNLAPSVFRVHLHHDDYDLMKDISSEIKDEAKKALQEEIERLNREMKEPWRLRNLPVVKNFRRFKEKRMPYKTTEGWEITFHPDDEIEIGEPFVDALWASPVRQEIVVGKPTKRVTPAKRVTTRRVGNKLETRIQDEDSGTEHPGRGIYAKITYKDDSGEQEFLMTKNKIKVGRGGIDHWVDLKLDTLPDVSREHLHIRYDDTTGQFYITDTSLYGTTTNGEELVKRVETLLPARARIGLVKPSPIVYLDFEAEEQQ